MANFLNRLFKKQTGTPENEVTTVTSGETKSVQRTRSRRMKSCVYGGLGDTLNKQRRKPNGYPGALLASFPQE